MANSSDIEGRQEKYQNLKKGAQVIKSGFRKYKDNLRVKNGY